MRESKNTLKTLLVALAGMAMMVPAAMAGNTEDGGCPGPWDEEDVNSWEEITGTHPNTCANPEVDMELYGEHHYIRKVKDCGDGTYLINSHINHGKVYARAQRLIPEGFDGYVAPDDPSYVAAEDLEAWLEENSTVPPTGKDERAMPPGWYETIWNSNGIFNGNFRILADGSPSTQVFICHFVAQKNPYTGVKEDYLYHENQHWIWNDGFELQHINEWVTCPGQGGTMTKICSPEIDEDCATE